MKRRIGQFLGHVLPGIIRPLHVLWNEVIGFIFLVLAALVVPSIVRNLRDHDSGGVALGRLLLAGTWMAVMTYFGISSFLRARKISRS